MMMRASFTDTEKAEIKAAYERFRDTKAAPRFKALWLYSTGKPVAEIAEITGLSSAYIPTLVHRIRRNGIKESIEDCCQDSHYTFTAEEEAAIELACSSVTSQYTLRRLEVLRLRVLGVKYREIEKRTGYSETSITRLVKEYKKCGLEAMVSMPRTGRRVYSAQNYELTTKQVAELKRAYDATSDRRAKNRIYALLRRSEGVKWEDISEETGLSMTHLSHIASQYRQNGITGILEKPRPARPPYIAYKYGFTEEQKAEIEAAHSKKLDPKATVRLKVLWLRANKKSYSEIAAATGFHPVHISSILRQYKEKGLAYVLTNQYSKRRRKTARKS